MYHVRRGGGNKHLGAMIKLSSRWKTVNKLTIGSSIVVRVFISSIRVFVRYFSEKRTDIRSSRYKNEVSNDFVVSSIGNLFARRYHGSRTATCIDCIRVQDTPNRNHDERHPGATVFFLERARARFTHRDAVYGLARLRDDGTATSIIFEKGNDKVWQTRATL